MTDNSPRRTYVNQIENRITSTIKTGYYLEILASETMKLLESIENKVTHDENKENVPCLKMTGVLLVYCNIFRTDYKQYSIVLYTFVPNKSIIRYFTQNVIFL